MDAVVSNPPYSQKWESDNKDNDPRYARFGMAPKTKADYAFLLHDLYHLKPDGIMTIVLPHGVLFRGGEEGQIRKKLIEANHIDAIIGLPPNIFFGTGIPTVIIVVKQKRINTDVLIVDASRGFTKVGKNNKLRASDIKKIVDAVTQREIIPNFSRAVSRDEIRENDYNLNIPRYVDSSDAAESWDIYASMFGGIPAKELQDLHKFWTAFPGLQDALFTFTSADYAALKTDDIKGVITHHADVKAFIANFSEAFDDFGELLKVELLTTMATVNIANEESTLSEDIFRRMEAVPLIDKYEAYQLLNDNWLPIAGDLEIIQTEGFDATRIVDPHIVIKKKDGKDTEVQEGWFGRIMPFELVQQTYLQDELEDISQKENRLAEISSAFEEILDSLTEEEKEADTINEAKDGFVNANVVKEAKQLKTEAKKKGDFDAESYEAKIIQVDQLITEEKGLKSSLNDAKRQLIITTKDTIENLTDARVYELLELNWITPLLVALNNLPEVMINQLTTTVQALADKYATTYADVAKDINQTEIELATLIDDLTANPFDLKGLNEFKTFLKGENNE